MTARSRSTAKAAGDGLPIANLHEARKEQAAARKRHPAGKALPEAGKPAAPMPAPAKAAKPAEAEKVTYSATARCGKTNTRASATPLSHAVDVKIAGRKGPHWQGG